MIYNVISLVKIKTVQRHNVHVLQNQHSINKTSYNINSYFSIIHCTCVTKTNKKGGIAQDGLNTA